MDQTAAGEGDELRLGIAPRRQRRRPFAAAVEGEDLLATGDDAAIDQAGEEWRQSAAGDRQHGLVEKRHALGDPPLAEQRPAMEVAGEGDEIGVVEAVADLGGLGRRPARSLEIAHGDAAMDRRQQQIAALGAILVRDEAFRARQPAGRAARLAEREEAEAKKEGGAGRRSRVVGVEAGLVDTFLDRQELVVAAGQRGRPDPQVKVLDGERRSGVGPAKGAIGVLPGAPRTGFATF